VYAAYYFGRDESLYFVQDIDATGPQGEDLQLSRLVVRNSFLLPYMVSDGGLVITVRGVRDSYIPLPDDSIIHQNQLSGLLPDPLPSSDLTTMDKIFGYSLWEALFAILAWSGLKRAFKRKVTQDEIA
jgi:hypothetical protein